MSISACDSRPAFNGSLEAYLRSQPERFGPAMLDPEKHRVQVIYTQIDRDENDRPHFTSYTYRAGAEYFYPASTVKLPVAALALEKLNTLDIDGLTRDTVMFVREEAAGKAIGRYVREVLLVSDNPAFNYMYEFLGQEPINDRLQRMGFEGTRIMHRLSLPMSVAANRHTGPVRFADADTVVHSQQAAYSSKDYTANAAIPIGVAEIIDGERIAGPKDFATKNAYPLQAHHDVVRSLIFPDAADPGARFDLSDDDYALLYRNMSAYPAESGIAEYADIASFPNSFVKFLVGGGGQKEIPDHIRSFNKAGSAYGFMTDAAYIADFERGIEFLLAATVYSNANGTFNDDTYEYDEVALPFLAALGEAIYEVELARDRAFPADLGRFVRLHNAPDVK